MGKCLCVPKTIAAFKVLEGGGNGLSSEGFMYSFCSVLFCFLLVEFDLNCLVQEIIPPSLDIKYHKHHCSRRKQEPTCYLFFSQPVEVMCA